MALSTPPALSEASISARALAAGLPAVSVPFGEENGLPIGVQFMGRAWDEALLLRAAQTLLQEV